MSCKSCRIDYEIHSGIPVLIDFTNIPEHLHKQIRYFEQEDAARADWTLEPWQERYVTNFLRYGKPKAGGIIVDNATGSGYMTIELARRGFRVLATDLTFRELVKLKQILKNLGLKKNVLLVCCDSQVLPIATSIADGLVANAILEHLPDERQAVEEITRVVKKKSPVMIAMPLVFGYILPFLWLINWWHDRRIGHLRRYSRTSILHTFRSFDEIAVYYTGHIMKVACLLMYVITKSPWWNKLGERLDERFQTMPYGASNIVAILRKK